VTAPDQQRIALRVEDARKARYALRGIRGLSPDEFAGKSSQETS